MSFRYRFAFEDIYSNGFRARVTLFNDGTQAVTGWTLGLAAGFTLGAVYEARSLGGLTFTDAGYNAVIPAGGSVSFGLTGVGASLAPASVTANGQAALAEAVASIADTTVLEGQEGLTAMVFTISLDHATTVPVRFTWRTEDGTATPGTDYEPASGSGTIAAGARSADVTVIVHGDAGFEPAETLILRVTDMSGALQGDTVATGTLRNDDHPPGSAAPGYFATRGGDIIDSAGQAVRLTAVNWFGLETRSFAPDGLYTRNWREMMDQIAETGFNAIRLPFSTELLDGRVTPTNINYALNPDLRGVYGIALIDKIVGYAATLGIRIILDRHRGIAGNGADDSGLWYSSAYDEARWISDWQMLAGRYAGNPTVIGADLHNEPWKGSWGDGDPLHDWRAAAGRAGAAIQAVNPNWLIFVEGVRQVGPANDPASYYWDGGNLSAAGALPVVLPVANHLVYSAHDYPPSIYDQPWFKDAGYPANLPALFDHYWGYLARQGIAPVFLGEFGGRLVTAADRAWIATLTAVLGGDLDANGSHDLAPGAAGVSWAWWAWNPTSGDTGGILLDDWRTVDPVKIATVAALLTSLRPDAAATDGDDVRTGTEGTDVLSGYGGNDLLLGHAGNDSLWGGGGRDLLLGGAGNDALDGGSGVDTALIASLRRQSVVTATTVVGPDGSDTLNAIETLHFQDGWLAIGGTAPAASIARLYLAALGRGPDATGLGFYTEAVASGRVSLDGIAASLLQSAEFQARFGAPNTEGFVTLLYGTVLGRAPDADGLAYWSGLLDGGLARSQAVAGFSESPEFIVGAGVPDAGGLFAPDPAAVEVLRWYETVLNRLPDAAGLSYWIETRAQREIGADFTGSAEFAAVFGVLDTAGFVARIYQNALDRDGDAGGIAYWSWLLDTGTLTRADVAASFAFSEEMTAKITPLVADGVTFA
ncbi:aryl-phospho-beta-D-glucosidase BglC (GH1 family) [Humitalea rosea]|uniref:cellulase n=1 Tax=Humitalea rosea TaxID=990373 RepID=A0A2W7IU04_9PROT|nr:DUF4214 domain-containing protein [Humitalea rosea]PZW50939.1 aryl-phospho-beta-D-glucosidase BglC (GH1 family) [Humitalea rosea]